MNVLFNRLACVISIIFSTSVTDVFMSFTRLIAETKYNKIGGVVAVILLIPVWTYFRCIAYPYNLYLIVLKSREKNAAYGKTNTIDDTFYILLGMIFILSCFWLYLIIKSTLNFLRKGVVTDS